MVGLRVVIAGIDATMVKRLEEVLRVLGCVVVGKAFDEQAAIKIIRVTQPEFVIIEGDRGFLETAKIVDENWLAPMVMVTDLESWHGIGLEIDRWGFEYIEKPFKPETLQLKMVVAVEKFQRNWDFALEARRIKSARTTRNLVDAAKDVLVEKLGVSEVQAILKIQMMGQSQSLPMREVAQTIIRSKQFVSRTA